MLIFGSYNTINTKLQYQTCADTLDKIGAAADATCPDGQKKFNKPWHVNLYMFLGEGTLLLAYGIQRRARRLAALTAREPMVGRDEGAKLPFYVFAVPAFCDVFGTGLAAMGQMYLDSAIWQMLRSSIIVFSALCSVAFLKRRLQLFHWVAVFIVMCGLVVVAVASMLDAGAATAGAITNSERILGFVLTVLAQCCAAFQMVFEEKLLTAAPGMKMTSAKKVIGMEGVWGTSFMMIILVLMHFMPGADGGHYESFVDGFYMLGSSPSLLVLSITYSLSIATYNFTGVTVGKKMTAVVRCLVDSCRILTVWAISLALYYFVSHDYGAGWGDHTWLTLIGFMVLVAGTVLYNDLAPDCVPTCLRRIEASTGADDDDDGIAVSASFIGVLGKIQLTDEAEEKLVSAAAR